MHGPASHADVQAWLDADGDGTPDFEASGELSTGSVTKIDRIKVFIARASENVTVHVGEIELSHGEVAVDSIEINGLGGPITGSFHSTFAAAHLQVKGEGIDLARFGRVSQGQRGAHRVPRDARRRSDGAPGRGDGHASLELGKCALSFDRGAHGADAPSDQVNGVSLGVEATLNGRKIAGRAHAELEDVGKIALTAPTIRSVGRGRSCSRGSSPTAG